MTQFDIFCSIKVRKTKSICYFFVSRRDKHRDKEHREHREHGDKEKHHSSKSSHDRHKERDKKATENGVAHIKSEPVVAIKEEQRDPLDTSNYSFSETNAIQANGIRECFVNVSQMSEASSCDYSMSQFRADESAFSIKGDRDTYDDSQASFAYNNDTLDGQGDDDEEEDMPIAQRKKIKCEISDDDEEDDMPLTARKKPKTEKKAKKMKREPSDDEADDYDKPKKKKIKKEKVSSNEGLYSNCICLV